LSCLSVSTSALLGKSWAYLTHFIARIEDNGREEQIEEERMIEGLETYRIGQQNGL